MMKFLLIVSVTIICFACSHSRLDNASSPQTIELKFDYGLRNFASALDTVEFIQLQTTDASIIGNIKQICYRKGKYYILDNQQHKILLFDEGGEFITSIDQRGQGPCESKRAKNCYPY
jgi:TusA-related sulfurtransferase